ncbi:MAG TPA: exodeoxyribonuclease VII small subunit [Gemmatimonadaceae bacterium]|jgi:exodeoxyribonuclease VII small subunit|nr:exodeoxyribonuclease VII small subunit [Gemmatimonadaceae bacterium]
MSYEDDVARIEAILEELEQDGVQLDRALALFEEGVERLRSASAALTEADARVRALVERADGSLAVRDLGG